MDELNLYQGEHTGREIDSCIQRVMITPGNGELSYNWVVRIPLSGTAGYETTFNITGDVFPNPRNSVVVGVSFTNEHIEPYNGFVNKSKVKTFRLVVSDNNISGGVTFLQSGNINVIIHFLSGADLDDQPA